MSISMTQIDIKTALKAFIVTFIGIDPDRVIAAGNNRVPLPKGGCVIMTYLYTTDHAINVDQYETDDDADTKDIQAHQTVRYQLDFYGPQAYEWANIVKQVYCNDTGCQFLRPYRIQPLYTEQINRRDYVNSAQQYEYRASLDIHLSYYPLVTVPQAYLKDATIAAIDAETLS